MGVENEESSLDEPEVEEQWKPLTGKRCGECLRGRWWCEC